MRPEFNLPKRLRLVRVRVGTPWLRIHRQGKGPLWFGPAVGTPPVNRFDDPEGQFRVSYLGTTVEVCFAETFLRNPPVRILALSDLSTRSIATIRVRRELRVIPVYGPNLARLGVTAAVATGNDYGPSQSLSRRLLEHAAAPDGILYRSRHDDSAMCVCIFERAKDGLEVIAQRPLTQDYKRLAHLLNRYGLALVN